jgi:hypothetical protein
VVVGLAAVVRSQRQTRHAGNEKGAIAKAPSSSSCRDRRRGEHNLDLRPAGALGSEL